MVPKLDSSSPDGKLRVLTLDGGGFRGLGMLLVLQEITKQANQRNREPSDPQLKPHEIFDIVVGSSAGGLVAVLVGRLGLDCETAIKEYKDLASTLFGTDRAEFMKTLLSDQKFGDTTIARYDEAVGELVKKYSGSPTTLFTDPPTNAKTIVALLPSAKPIHTLVHSFETKGSSSNAWTTKDVIRATTAAPGYLPPYKPLGVKQVFTDAASAGKGINPTVSAKDFWGKDLGILVNIGQWFSAVKPLAKPLTKGDTKRFKDIFLGGVNEDPKVKTDDTLKLYLRQAQLAQEALGSVQKEPSLQPAGIFKRLDPPLGPDNRLLELVDIFFEDEIRREVQKWNTDNVTLLTEIATKLVKPDDQIPEPIPDVHPYNPALNAKKPKEMLPYLKTYHVIFIIDDSTSMLGGGRWRQAEQSIGPIADFAFKNNVTSVDMGFMHYNRANPIRGIQDQQKVLEIFRQAKPHGRGRGTPTGAVLKFFIDQTLQELNSKINDPEAYMNLSPTDIIMLTDGEADDDPKAVIRNAGVEMKANKHNPNYLGIQMVQVGNSSLTKLGDITKGDYGEMVDLVLSDGADLTEEKLRRIVLGGIHPTVRRKLRAQDSQ